MVCNITTVKKKNELKIIQTAGYNGARTVHTNLSQLYTAEFSPKLNNFTFYYIDCF